MTAEHEQYVALMQREPPEDTSERAWQWSWGGTPKECERLLEMLSEAQPKHKQETLF